jgi:hypothetical protein
MRTALLVALTALASSAGPLWKPRAALPRPNPFPAQSPVAINGRIYVLEDVTGALYEFDPEHNVWTGQRSTMPTRRHHYATVALGGKLYVLGGCVGEEGGKHQRIAIVTIAMR